MASWGRQTQLLRGVHLKQCAEKQHQGTFDIFKYNESSIILGISVISVRLWNVGMLVSIGSFGMTSRTATCGRSVKALWQLFRDLSLTSAVQQADMLNDV